MLNKFKKIHLKKYVLTYERFIQNKLENKKDANLK